MSFKIGFRRPKSADAIGAWTERLESMYAADHPRYPRRYGVYLSYVAFLTAGIVEHHWAEGIKSRGRGPFVPLGVAEEFLPDLHRKMRAFRESRFIDGSSSSELTGHSYELLGFLVDRIPAEELERFLAMARTYIIQNEDECLSS